MAAQTNHDPSLLNSPKKLWLKAMVVGWCQRSPFPLLIFLILASPTRNDRELVDDIAGRMLSWLRPSFFVSGHSRLNCQPLVALASDVLGHVRIANTVPVSFASWQILGSWNPWHVHASILHVVSHSDIVLKYCSSHSPSLALHRCLCFASWITGLLPVWKRRIQLSISWAPRGNCSGKGAPLRRRATKAWTQGWKLRMLRWRCKGVRSMLIWCWPVLALNGANKSFSEPGFENFSELLNSHVLYAMWVKSKATRL